MSEKPKTIVGLPYRTALTYTLIFTLAFCLYSSMWQNAPIMAGDSTEYLETAQDLSDFHIDQPHERAPGYPFILLITGSIQSPTRRLFFLSMIFHFASIWILSSALYSIGLAEIILHLLALLLVFPLYMEPAAYVLTENLTEFMLVTGFVCLVFWYVQNKKLWVIISAVTIGYSGLTRPTYQALWFFIVMALLLSHTLLNTTSTKLKDVIFGSLILIFISALMISGYSFIDYYKFGYFDIATPKFGLTLSTKTMRFVERLPGEYAEIKEILITILRTFLRGNIPMKLAVYGY